MPWQLLKLIMRQSVHPRNKQMDDVFECHMTRFLGSSVSFFALLLVLICSNDSLSLKYQRNNPFFLTAFKEVKICISLKY